MNWSRLKILHADNERLESILNKLVEQHEKLDCDSQDEMEPDEEEEEPEKTELRPIPGIFCQQIEGSLYMAPAVTFVVTQTVCDKLIYLNLIDCQILLP